MCNEKQRAQQKLENFLLQGDPCNNSSSCTKEFLVVSGNIEKMAQVVINELPTGRYIGSQWRWNQSNGKVDTLLTNPLARVTYSKLILRRKNGVPINDELPPRPYRIWHYEVTELPSQKTYHVLWCEVGEVITIDDLAFLAPFCSPEDRMQFFSC